MNQLKRLPLPRIHRRVSKWRHITLGECRKLKDRYTKVISRLQSDVEFINQRIQDCTLVDIRMKTKMTVAKCDVCEREFKQTMRSIDSEITAFQRGPVSIVLTFMTGLEGSNQRESNLCYECKRKILLNAVEKLKHQGK